MSSVSADKMESAKGRGSGEPFRRLGCRMLVFDWKRRALLFMFGVAVAGLGVALSTQAGLGATPISSVPWVLTRVTPLSYGTLTLLMNLLFVFGQIVVLRRRFAPFQLLQVPATALFGVCIDGGMALTRPWVTAVYPLQVLMLVGGASLLAVGIVCQVHSDFLCVPGDALVKTVAQTFRLRLARVKTCFDATLVLSALAVSYALLHRVEGVREGTVLGVFLVGWFVGLALPRLRGLRKSCYHWVAT